MLQWHKLTIRITLKNMRRIKRKRFFVSVPFPLIAFIRKLIGPITTIDKKYRWNFKFQYLSDKNWPIKRIYRSLSPNHNAERYNTYFTFVFSDLLMYTFKYCVKRFPINLITGLRRLMLVISFCEWLFNRIDCMVIWNQKQIFFILFILILCGLVE